MPGTAAYEKREQDALPDEITVVPEGPPGRSQSPAGSVKAGSSPVPQTMDQKIDTASPTHSEATGTEAHEDAVSGPETSAEGQPIPETKVSQVDTSQPEEELPSRPRAHRRSPSDALPDTVETVPDPHLPVDFPAAQKAPPQDDFDDDQGAGDDFDEFVEEQDDMGDDDFGDFDDGFQEPSADVVDAPPEGSTVQQPHAPPNIVRASISSLDTSAVTNCASSPLWSTSTPLAPPLNFSIPLKTPLTTSSPPLKT